LSSLRVTVERLTIHEHPNADALELAQVGLFRAVVLKGRYKTGDYALYIPEQAVLPPDLIEELGLTGRLAGKDKNRVKAIRLRGELSQGIVCRPAALPINWDHIRFEIEEGITHDWHGQPDSHDFAEKLGIAKWVPPIPVGMSGQVESAPDLIRWIDIENIKRYPDIFEAGEYVAATEKLHGSACLYTLDAATGREYVSSKGVGAQQLALQEDAKNLYWRAVRAHRLKDAAAAIAAKLGAARVGLFGEVYGKGVQDLAYGADASHDETLGYALFDIAAIGESGALTWVGHAERVRLAEEFDVPTVPTLYVGAYNYGHLAALAEGNSHLDGAKNIREGLVIRPVDERRSDLLGGRAIGKIVSEGYLLRDGNATEFE
jgi:RNA ligase (TIGR02306 family)